MTTESNSTAVEVAESDIERPAFRGCVFCYGAELTYYGARKLARKVTSGD